MKHKWINSLLLLIFLLSGVVFHALSAPFAVGITGISPTTAPNNVSTVLTITGADFVDGAVVSLDGYGPLATTYLSATSLNAVLPVGVPAATYNVTVTLPDTSTATLPGGLTVILPASPTATVTTVPPGTYERPVIVVLSYSTSASTIYPGQNFDLYVQIYNSGQHYARNIVASFIPGLLLPRETGGVISAGEVAPGNRKDFTQPLTASWDLWGQISASIDMTVSYTDEAGSAYAEKFTLVFPITPPKPGAPTATPTVTPTATLPPYLRPQLVISNYTTSVSPLQPGTQFTLDLQVQNVGNDLAKTITMIVGGGSGASASATLEPGGISGASGEFTNFAPIGSSNIQSLGDLPAGQMITASQPLIVNTSTNPGAYPMPISFTFLNEKGNVITDEQVITLLVYQVPNVEISFYRDPNPITAGQPNILPLQAVNLGKSSVVLGNMEVTGEGAEFSNNVVLVGTLDVGMYFTLDANMIPAQPGPLDLLVTIDYTDDFNQFQVITQTLTVEVQEMFMPGPGMEGGEGSVITPELPPETFWQKVLRFFKGLLGLGSDRSAPEIFNEMPAEGVPFEESVPVQPSMGP
jgi:hypothetical protein